LFNTQPFTYTESKTHKGENKMTETLTALEVCCCGNCATAGHPKEVIRPLTAAEITQRNADAATAATRKAEEDAAATAKATAKASANAKLKALGLSDAEIAAL
jgi:hypothetical protein